MTTQEKVAEEYNKGERNPYMIAKKLGVSVWTVRDYLSRSGLKLGKKTCVYNRAIKTGLIMSDIKLGVLSMAKIAQRYGVSRQYVFNLKEELKRKNEI